MKKEMQLLPQLSHLQVLVLECLGTRKCSGRELRRLLEEKGTKKSGPAFYQLMARLEEARFVEGEYSQKIVEGQIIKERHYRISAEGAKAMRSTFSFYDSIRRLAIGGRTYA
jgi:DNA-binding PadR family transcriptional regulator